MDCYALDDPGKNWEALTELALRPGFDLISPM